MPLRVLFAATNEIPEQGELAALKDRFVLKVQSRPVQDEHFTELIDTGLQGEAYRGLNQKPWIEGHATLDDFLKANRYLTYLFGRTQADGRGEEQNDRTRFFPADVFREFQRLVKTLVREDKIFISDRKLVKLYKLFRVRAWLFSGGTVSRDDLRLLAYLARRTRRSNTSREKVPQLLGQGRGQRFHGAAGGRGGYFDQTDTEDVPMAGPYPDDERGNDDRPRRPRDRDDDGPRRAGRGGEWDGDDRSDSPPRRRAFSESCR